MRPESPSSSTRWFDGMSPNFARKELPYSWEDALFISRTGVFAVPCIPRGSLRGQHHSAGP